uniref:Succinate dehydrogenase n=1 Tax=Desulfobacca acetoxidans TaxID=60893 RepID=A0A7C5EL31_9BACT
MYLQKSLAQSPRWEALVEMVELGTGLLLLVFLQFHLLAVSSIILGAEAFNRDSRFLDEYYISYIGIPLVILAILVHGLAAMRKAPWNLREARTFWQHSRRLGHLDTWLWLVQIVTGGAILILAAIHVWSTLLTWPIEAHTSALRVQGGYFTFLLVLLAVAEVHAMAGLYRLLVKWGFWHRKRFGLYLVYVTAFFLALGLIALLVFYFLNVKGTP